MPPNCSVGSSPSTELCCCSSTHLPFSHANLLALPFSISRAGIFTLGAVYSQGKPCLPLLSFRRRQGCSASSRLIFRALQLSWVISAPQTSRTKRAGNHEQLCSFGVCVGTYSMRLQHTLELLLVLHGAKFPILDKDDWIQGKGQN